MPNEREVFYRLFVGKGPMRPARLFEEALVFGLFNFYKWDQALVWEKQNDGKMIPADELARMELSDDRVREIEERVAQDLEAFAHNRTKPLEVLMQDLKQHHRPRFWYGVAQSLVSAFLYTMLVAGILFGLAYNGVNLPGVEVRHIYTSGIAR